MMTDSPPATPLAQWLIRTGRTQRDLAEQLDISEAHVSRLVDGTRTPSLPLAIRISTITGLPPADLVGAER